MKLFQLVIICFLLLVNFISNAFCQDITLSWDPSPTAGVSGYMVYYKAGDSALPFDGTVAAQGASPIDVGDNLTSTLTSLDEGVTYYFSVTAYDYNNNQSTFSNIVNNDTETIIIDPEIDPPNNNWSPTLLTPNNNALTELLPVLFSWENDRADITYTLYYGTNEEEVTNAGLLIVLNPTTLTPDNSLIIFTILALLLTILIKVITRSNYKTKLQALPLVVIVLGGILTACGGGGGGGGGSESGHTSATSNPVVATTSLYAVETNNEVYFRDYDMSQDTTYYWKVIATDTTDPTTTYPSEVRKFKTEI